MDRREGLVPWGGHLESRHVHELVDISLCSEWKSVEIPLGALDADEGEVGVLEAVDESPRQYLAAGLPRLDDQIRPVDEALDPGWTKAWPVVTNSPLGWTQNAVACGPPGSCSMTTVAARPRRMSSSRGSSGGEPASTAADVSQPEKTPAASRHQPELLKALIVVAPFSWLELRQPGQLLHPGDTLQSLRSYQDIVLIDLSL